MALPFLSQLHGSVIGLDMLNAWLPGFLGHDGPLRLLNLTSCVVQVTQEINFTISNGSVCVLRDFLELSATKGKQSKITASLIPGARSRFSSPSSRFSLWLSAGGAQVLPCAEPEAAGDRQTELWGGSSSGSVALPLLGRGSRHT